MFWIELLIVLVMIFIGTRKGGPFMALAGGIGMFILTFFLHVSPSDPPITVIRIMIAVILAASAMQAAGGLDYMVRLAEKILRKHPEHITVLAPVIAYIFTFMCGTGHIVYSLLPVINEIAMDTGIRPERPISATVVASQNAFPTSTIFIVGGIFPLSKALVSSGAAEYLVNAISPVLSNLPPIVLLGAITFLMLLTTQFLMNSSATVLVLPIAIMLCQAAGINPLAGAMSVSVCASGAFVTPFGTAPNLLVWEAGGYSVKDYLKCGFPMLIIFGVVTTALCAVFYL